MTSNQSVHAGTHDSLDSFTILFVAPRSWVYGHTFFGTASFLSDWQKTPAYGCCMSSLPDHCMVQYQDRPVLRSVRELLLHAFQACFQYFNYDEF